MILEGHTSQILNERSHFAVNISQIIRFNFVKQQERGLAENLRLCITKEPPSPVAVALMIYSKTRKKALVNEISSEGLCVRYQ